MKKLLLSSVFLVIVALAFGQESAAPPKDLSGFSGYAWGTSIDFISSTMESEGYDLTSSGQRDLWYRGEVLSKPLNLVYYFENGMLISGMWIFDDTDKDTFWHVNNFLRDEYNSDASLKIRGELFIESEMQPFGTDAWIIHKLDIEADSHIVHYYYQRGEE
jgi:hypothetical protein